jgi:hypothetical protein
MKPRPVQRSFLQNARVHLLCPRGLLKSARCDEGRSQKLFGDRMTSA